MLVYVVRRLGFQALSCSAGAGNWFGAAGWRAGSTGYRRADVVMPVAAMPLPMMTSI